MQKGDHTRPVTLITGAARRIGAQIARTLHAAGHDLMLHYRSSEAEMQALCAELESARGRSVGRVQADLADTAALPGIVAAAVRHFGRLDALVNNASAYYATPLMDATPAQWDELFAANARAPFFLAQAAAPHLKASRGAIVNITDIYAERPLAGHAVYCASKAALMMLTRSLAQELGPEVRVNAVAPGNILWSTNPDKAETEAMVTERTALARQGDPEDIARAVLYLLRDATYVSGITLPVDGGRLLHV